MFKSLFALTRREDGQTMAEYGVVLAVITLGIVVALTALSGGISAAIDAVTGILSRVNSRSGGPHDAPRPHSKPRHIRFS